MQEHSEGIHRKENGTQMPVLDMSDLINRTYITNPDKNGEQLRAVIDQIEKTKERTADKKEALYKFRAKAGDKVYEEMMTYNQMLEWCDRDLDKDDFFNF